MGADGLQKLQNKAMKKILPKKEKKEETPIKVTDKIKGDPLVLKGQWVRNAEGKDLLLIDPTDQPYEIVYADKESSSVTGFDRDELE